LRLALCLTESLDGAITRCHHDPEDSAGDSALDGLINGIDCGGKNFDCGHGSELYPATVVERRAIYPPWGDGA
jgi:hypothetical protein